MKKKKSVVLIGLICIILTVMFIFPGSGFCKAKKLYIGWSEGPQAGMNPFLARNEGDYIFMSLMYEPLVVPLMDGTVIPWLAKSWKYDKGQDAWTFSLNKKAKWSDGTPLTSEDVKFTFDAAYENNFPIGSTTKSFVKSIEAVDKYTVKFNMKQGFAAFLPIAGGTMIMPKHIWSKVGKIDEFKNPAPVSSGPFVYKEYKPRAFLHLTKNKNYWQGASKIDEIIIKIFMNTEAAVVALKKGELDIMPDLSGNESLIPAILGDKNINVLIDKWPHILYVAPNHRQYPLNVKEFRKAIDIAIDKKGIIKTALAGYGELPLMGYVPPLVTKWANTKLTWRGLEMTTEQRLAEANSILDNLGFMKGSDGIRVTDKGKKLELSIRCMTYPSYIRASEMIKDDLTKIGIKVEVIVSDPETLYGGIIFSGKRPDDWQLLVHGSTMNPDPDNFAREYAPDPPTPWDNATAFGWSNEKIQSILKQSRKEMDSKKRWELIQKAQELFAEELVVMTIGHRFHPAAHRTDRFTGWNPEPVCYGGMVHPLGSIVNIYSLQPK